MMRQPIDPRHARSALFAIDPGCARDEWHRIGRAAIAAGLSVDDLDEWSAQADNYAGTKDVRAAFRSVNPNGGTGPGTLWRLAMDAGWRPPSDNESREVHPVPNRPKKSAQRPASTPRGPSAAAQVWERLQPATSDHAYIAAKRGRPDGLRVVPADDERQIADQFMAGALVVPVVPLAGGDPVSLQFIGTPEQAARWKAAGRSGKLNLPGAQVAGVFVVGELQPAGTAYLCEGIGQAWACWQAGGHAAVVCFGWGRVRSVAAELRERDAAMRLVLVPDVGKESEAAEIAREVGGFVAAMPEGWPANADVNDLAQRDGCDALEVLLQGAVAPAAPIPLLRDVDIAQLLHAEPASTAWWWDGYVPADHVTLVGSHGGAGKSTIFAGLGACIAVGKPFLGRDTKRGKVLFFSGEDPAGLVAIRLARICRALEIDPADLHDTFRLIDATEGEPALFTERRLDGTRTGVTTPTYAALAEYVKANQIDVLIADNASDVFDADEISRPLVRGFIRSLARLIRERGGAVVLLAHVDKGTSRGKGGAGSENYSGSTAWHNSVRSRLFLAEREPGSLELLHQKCNLGPKLAPMMLEWPHDSIPQLAEATGGFVQHIANSTHTKALLKLIHEFSERGEFVSTATTSRAHAGKLLRGESTFPARLTDAELFDLLRTAERRALLERHTFRGIDRKQRERWQVTAEGREAAGIAATSPTDPGQDDPSEGADCGDKSVRTRSPHTPLGKSPQGGGASHQCGDLESPHSRREVAAVAAEGRP